jgi:DNA end-binding protein Ku
MAAPAFWKGYLKLSLVTCPVALVPAITGGEKVRFHTLSRASGARVVSRYVDAGTGQTVDDEDTVKGYPTGDERYVMLEDEELDRVALETTHTIDIACFVAASDLDRIWLDRPHYLVPDDPVGTEAYAVIREAMAASATLGIARLVLYRRERAVMLQPRDRGMVLWTLRYGDEVRDPAAYFGAIDAADPPADQLKLTRALVARRARAWKPELTDDPVQARLLDIVAARRKGRRLARPKAPESAPRRNVIDIMDALKRSLAGSGKAKGRG